MHDYSEEVARLTRAAYAACRAMHHSSGCACTIRSGVEDRLAYEAFPQQRFVPVGEFLPCGACLAATLSCARNVPRLALAKSGA